MHVGRNDSRSEKNSPMGSMLLRAKLKIPDRAAFPEWLLDPFLVLQDEGHHQVEHQMYASGDEAEVDE